MNQSVMLQFPAINTKTKKIGDWRHYLIDQVWMPSVTSIISLTSGRVWMSSKKVSVMSSADRGTAVHELAERKLKGSLGNCYPLQKEITPYWARLEPWIDENIIDPLAVELLVWHPQVEYAGRLDCLAITDRGLTLIDWKTTKSRHYIRQVTDDHHLQLAAYGTAAEIRLGGDAEIVAYCDVYVTPDGVYPVWFDGAEVKECFEDFVGLRRDFDRCLSEQLATQKSERLDKNISLF